MKTHIVQIGKLAESGEPYATSIPDGVPRTVMTSCSACAAQRVHTEEEWKNHPLRCHGFDGVKWTHPEAKALHDAELEFARKERERAAGGGAA